MTTGRLTKNTYLVKGDDPSLVALAVRSLLAEVVGDRDQALVVEEVGGGTGDDINVGAVVDACLTPPFLIDRRVVVVREAGRLLTADVPRLVEVVNDPLPTTVLILVGGGGTIPAPLVKAVTAAGQVMDVSVNRPNDRKAWLAEHLRSAPVKLDARAAQLLGQHVGEDLGRVEGLLSALSSAYGEGARITVDDLEPYLGEAGNVARYELTDAIDRGDPAAALAVLHRLVEAGGLSGVEVLFSLHRHYSNMLTLDGANVSSGEEAAQLLSVGSAYVGKKALEQSRRLGSARIATAITLLADADSDVKGGSGLPPELVVEILVARLSRQTRQRAGAGRR
ncbi:MAG TPA: DNA polymerase III subunit delta [Acidimicrobiales bacterium]|jgi:DNA polymerase-3 subunit delta|nr:DNA polymerase III subunit delta [Acidimicrobiales bacterium]